VTDGIDMKRILVVDDSFIIRSQVTATLNAEGFVTVGAADGVDALEKLASYPDIGFIVCDVMMPRMGGMELLEHLRAAKNMIDFVMLTTEAQPELVQRARALGVRGWLNKPLPRPLLLSLARHMMGAPLSKVGQ
jgi:two-component system chemotaxis response regulator CheY